MFIRKLTAVALLGTLFGASSAAQAYAIDSFTDPAAQLALIDHSNPANEAFNQEAAPLVFGGYRDVYLTNASAPSDNFSRIDAGSDWNSLKITNDPDVTATAIIAWDGNDSPTSIDEAGLSPRDLTESNADNGFYLDLVYLSAGVTIDLTVWSGTGIASTIEYFNTSLVDFNSNIGVDHIFLPFADFTGSANFGGVTAIELAFSGGNGYRAEVYQFDTRYMETVPEPTTLALAGIGLVALARRRAAR